jgi:tetratricopeptide (TPR) repeat protein
MNKKYFKIIFCFWVLSTVWAQNMEQFRFKRAMELEQNGSLEEAVREYRAALLDNPEDAEAFGAIARIRSAQKQYQYALRNYQAALRLEPANGRWQEGLARSYSALGDKANAIAAWRLLESNGDEIQKKIAQKQIASLQGKGSQEPSTSAGVEQNPTSSKPTTNAQQSNPYKSKAFLEGLRLLEAGKCQESLQSWRQVLKQYPGNPGAYYYAGVCRYNLNDYAKAIFNFKKGLSYPELGFNGYYYLGRIAEKQNRPADARVHYNQYLKNTQKPEGIREVQQRLENLGTANNQASTPEAKESSAIDSTAPKSVYVPNVGKPHMISTFPFDVRFIIQDTSGQGASLLREAYYEGGRKLINQTIELLKKVRLEYPGSANNFAAAVNLTELYKYLGLFDNGLNIARTALRENPPQAYENMLKFLIADLLTSQKEFVQANKMLQSVQVDSLLGPYSQQKKSLSAVIAAGLQATTKQGDGKLESIIEAEQDPLKKAGLLVELGDIHAQKGKKAATIRAYKEAIKHCKGDDSICRLAGYKLGDLYYKDKNWIMAEKYYQQGVSLYPDSTDAPWGLYQLGNISSIRQDYPKAVEYYDRVLAEYSGTYWAEQAKWKKEDAIWQEEYRPVLK